MQELTGTLTAAQAVLAAAGVASSWAENCADAQRSTVHVTDRTLYFTWSMASKSKCSLMPVP